MKLRGLAVAAVLALSACTSSSAPRAHSVTKAGTPSPTPTPISTATPTTGPEAASPPLPGAPRQFVAVLAGRLAVFDAASGHRLRWLTTHAANVEDAYPHVVVDRAGTSVVFARLQPGVCARADVLRVPLAGGMPKTVLRLNPSQFDALDVERDGSALAYGVTSCRDSEPRIRVIALPSGRTLATATSRCCDNGVFSLGGLALHGDRLTISLGVHNSGWTAIMRVPGGRAVLLEKLPQIPTPSACGFGALGGHERLWSDQTLVTVESCNQGQRVTTSLVSYSGAALQHRRVDRVLDRDERGDDLSGSDGRGHFIGIHTLDIEGQYSRRILQIGPHGQRLLAECPDINGTQDSCATQAVW